VGTFSDLFSRLDADDRVKGMQFEHICKWFLSNDPLYKARLRRAWLWKEWPDRWSDTEAGIDLVAEDYDGHLWAVQAKAYREDRAIPKSELNKFLSESNRAIFSDRLLIATTDGLHHIAKATLGAQEKSVYFVGLSDLRAADAYLEWPNSPDDLRPAPLTKPTKPYDYQRDAINDVVQGFKNADRGQLVMACGTGKTLISLFIKEKLTAQRTLVLVPSLSLLKQTMREWFSHRSEEFAVLPVCSDATVSRNDAAVMYTSDLGVPVTTDATEIAAFLRKRGQRVVFSTYQSSPQIAAAFQEGRVPAFDLVIADEAHRCAGPSSSAFAIVLDAAKIKAKKRLLMTATPRYFTGRVLKAAEEMDFEYASMDDEAKFGRTFHRLGFSEAIRRGLLTDYQVAIVGVDDATYRDWADRAELVTLDGVKVTDARTLAGQIGLAKAMRKYDLHRTISFHSRVKRAKDFALSMPAVIAWIPHRQRPKGNLWSDYASGEMSAGERGRLIQRLRQIEDDERGLLSNARCLAEGVDVPTLDGVAFIDPRRSEVDIVQAVGRAIRLAEDKTVGTIVIPVFIDTGEDAEIALDNSAFKPVWDVIKALRAHDDELAGHLDELRRQLGRQGGRPLLPDKIHFDLPARVGSDFARAFDVRLVEQTTASWHFWFGLLQQFAASSGHASPPAVYEVDGYSLGEWVSTQRDRNTLGRLEVDRQRLLDEFDGWTWDPIADKWEEGFQVLMRYASCNGHVRMRSAYVVNGYPLGAWVNTQRSFYNRGVLDPEKQSRLLSVPGWAWDPYGDKWEVGFSRLLEYVERHGHARVRRFEKLGEHNLGGWVKSQRRAFGDGSLNEDRKRRLAGLVGWTWDSYADLWEERFGLLLGYVERYGDALVPTSYTADDGYELGRWVAVQRNFQKDGTLESARRARLDILTGWSWSGREAMWEEGFQHLLNYGHRNGDFLVPAAYKTDDDYPLGQWVTTQRQFHIKGTLGPDRDQRLRELTGWTWSGRDAQWEERFLRLLAYVDRTGDSLVQRRYKDEDGTALGIWLMRQRKSYADGTLESNRVDRLGVLPGWRWARDAIGTQ
jgi:superfamily II DNA or RNA helicase